MNTHTLRCTACSRDHTPDMRTLHCQECASPLVVAYPSDAEPVLNASPVSLGEGHTPVVSLPTFADSLGLNTLYAKLEFAAPTGSFKDRGTAVMLAVAREFGIDEIVEDSSGNAGASVAAYAARCGIKAHVFAPDSAPETKLRQIKVYGAELHLVPGPREAAAEAALAFCEVHNLVYASHNLSPYFLEGTKTFAHELPTDFPDGLPDHIVVPVGNGSLFLGAWLGLRELQQRGSIDTLPKLHVVQAEPVMPIVAAFRGQTWAPAPGSRTIAGGISVADPPRLAHVLSILTRVRRRRRRHPRLRNQVLAVPPRHLRGPLLRTNLRRRFRRPPSPHCIRCNLTFRNRPGPDHRLGLERPTRILMLYHYHPC